MPEHKVDCSMQMTNNWQYVDVLGEGPNADAIEFMMSCILNFIRTRRVWLDEGEATRNIMNKAYEEMGEVIDAIDEAAHDNDYRSEHIKEELVDLMWMTLAAMMAQGMDASAVLRAFRIKQDINQHRIHSGDKPGSVIVT